MQTLERNNSVKYTVNISQEMGEPQEASLFLSNTLQAIFTLVEKRGIKLTPSSGIDMTPEFLEKLLLKKEKNKPSENATVNAIFDSIDKTGGLSGDGEKITQMGKEFRESFQFRADQD